MCYCLLTLLHFKVSLSTGWDDCSVCVKPLFFQGKFSTLSPFINTCHPHVAYQCLNVPEEGQFIIREN
jgi:hypothetical protein